MPLLGEKLPIFTLPNVMNNRDYTIVERGFVATIVMVWCNHCPFVKHLADHVVEVAQSYVSAGVELQWVAISANDPDNYPDDSPEMMRAWAKESGWPHPYLYDGEQKVVKELGAACTPDFYIADRNLVVRYVGRYDDSQLDGNVGVTGLDFQRALTAIMQDQEIDFQPVPSCGCNIKWRS